MFSISFRKYRDAKKKIIFARAIITSTACASVVFLLGYRNTVLNQSAWIFALGYFLKKILLCVPDGRDSMSKFMKNTTDCQRDEII